MSTLFDIDCFYSHGVQEKVTSYITNGPGKCYLGSILLATIEANLKHTPHQSSLYTSTGLIRVVLQGPKQHTLPHTKPGGGWLVGLDVVHRPLSSRTTIKTKPYTSRTFGDRGEKETHQTTGLEYSGGDPARPLKPDPFVRGVCLATDGMAAHNDQLKKYSIVHCPQGATANKDFRRLKPSKM